MIPAFWLSAVEYFSMICVDPSVHPPGRKAGVQDAIHCSAFSFGIKSREVSPDCPVGAGAPVWRQGCGQWGSHAGVALATALSLEKFALSLMDFGV